MCDYVYAHVSTGLRLGHIDSCTDGASSARLTTNGDVLRGCVRSNQTKRALFVPIPVPNRCVQRLSCVGSGQGPHVRSRRSAACTLVGAQRRLFMCHVPGTVGPIGQVIAAPHAHKRPRKRKVRCRSALPSPPPFRAPEKVFPFVLGAVRAPLYDRDSVMKYGDTHDMSEDLYTQYLLVHAEACATIQRTSPDTQSQADAGRAQAWLGGGAR